MFKGVSLLVEEGEFFGLFGFNGVGKIMFISIFVGFVWVDEGSILVCGYDVV